MNILTDEKMREIGFGSQSIGFARAIEALLMSKLAEQAGVEPVAWNYELENEPFRRLIESGVSSDAPLYTEAQYLAAQQHTAEACAKVCEAERSEDGDGQHPAWYAGFDACAEAIRNGEWRKYL